MTNFHKGTIDIPFEQLIADKEYDISIKKLQELAQSINENGLLIPFSVFEKDNKYHIIDGTIRYYILKQNPPKTVPCCIITGALCDDIVALRQMNRFKFSYNF
jgi:ParB-like chromosome segregation protein Spo0J